MCKKDDTLNDEACSHVSTLAIRRTGGQIKNDDNSDDVKNVDLSQVHYLSGPIDIPTAQPGDLLKVEFLDLGPLDGDEWGFT